MMRYSRFKSPRRLCEGIERAIHADETAPAPERLVRRPFNHYTPALTNWWIVPALELPFFKFGKYFFCWNEKKRDRLQCGFYLAKGLDPMLAKVYPTKKGRRLLMDDSWAWHTFYPACRRGEFGEIVRSAAAAVQLPIEIIFEGGYVDDPGLFNPDSELRKRDRYTLGYDPAGNTLKILPGTRRDAMCLKFLNKIRDWKSFEEAMKTLHEEQFLWCDIFVSCAWAVRGGAEPESDDEAGDSADEIFQKWLKPFLPFVR